MIQITTDEKTLLRNLTMYMEPVEINDSKGNIVGIFVPANLERGRKLNEQMRSTASSAEIERRSKSNVKCSTTLEVFERLLAMTPDPIAKSYLQHTIDDLKELDACATR